MIVYCSKCDINWAALKQIVHDELDEQYEVCPLCNSNHHLTDANSLDAYICNPMTGAITNVDTNEPYLTPSLVLPPMPTAYEKAKAENALARRKAAGIKRLHPEIQKLFNATNHF